MWFFVKGGVVAVMFMTASLAHASCITVNRNQVSTQWSIVDKALERFLSRNYHRQVDFTCSDWGRVGALCMPDWMRNTPGMGGANPMTFCRVSVGTQRQVFLTNQATVNRWLDAERKSRRNNTRHQRSRNKTNRCLFKGEMLKKIHCR